MIKDKQRRESSLDDDDYLNKLNWQYLVMANKDFVVYVGTDGVVHYDTSVAYDRRKPKCPEAHNEILNEAAVKEIMPSGDFDESVKLQFRIMIGEAMARTLDGDYDIARKTLDRANNFISTRYNERARLWYLTGCGAVSLCVLFTGCIFWLHRSSLLPFLSEGVFMVLMASASGCLGALLSILLRMGKAELDIASGKMLHYAEGGFKILTGCISGVLAALVVKTGIILPFISKSAEANWSIMLMAFVAGASEKWAPSIIASISAVDKTKEPSATDKKKEQSSVSAG